MGRKKDPTGSKSDSDDESSIGIDNVCLRIDKYLDDLEKTMDIKQTTTSHRRSISLNSPSSSSDEKTLSSSTKFSYRRYSLDDQQDPKDSMVEVSIPEEEPKFLKLVWRNLTYMVKSNCWRSKFPKLCKGPDVKKVILDKQNGEIFGGQLTAVIGPSGAGKSTLLECIAGRRKDSSGDIYLVYDKDMMDKGQNIRISFIGQKDHLLEVMTVEETLIFACQIKNYDRIKNRYYHPRLVKSVLKELGLDICSDVKVGKISGGQLKRLSFAMELISGPDILVLDEPTSGLDSSSAYQCIQLLRRLTDLKNQQHRYKAPAVILSIHQPSAKVLNIFHQVYILSSTGRCLYRGSPYALITYLSQLGLQCPQFHNPSDYIIEIASGDYGLEPVNKLAIAESDRHLLLLKTDQMLLSKEKLSASHLQAAISKPNLVKVKVSKIIIKMKNKRFPVFRHTWLHLKRTCLSTIREPKLTWLRVLQAIFIGLVMSYLYDHPIGEPDGCIPSPVSLTSGTSIPNPVVATQDNIAFIFFITLFTVMASMMPTVLTFPTEVAVLQHERNNGWYSCSTYYWAKVMADSPYQILITILFCSIIYPMTGQVHSEWRFIMFNIIAIQVSSIAQCIGMLFGTIYVDDVKNAVFMAPLSMTPMFLLSGFFGKISTIPAFLKPIAYVSYVRYAFEAFLVVLYGFDRCSDNLSHHGSSRNFTHSPLDQELFNAQKDSYYLTKPGDYAFNKYAYKKSPKVWSNHHDPTNQIPKNFYQRPNDLYLESSNDISEFYLKQGKDLTMKSGSVVLSHFDLDDGYLWQNLIILSIILICLRLLAYLILLMKTNQKK